MNVWSSGTLKSIKSMIGKNGENKGRVSCVKIIHEKVESQKLGGW